MSRKRSKREKNRKRQRVGTVAAPVERFEAEEPDEVDGERLDAPRSSAGQLVWSLSKLAVGIGVVLGAAFAVAYGAHRFASTTTRFAIQKYEVEGNHRYSDEQLAHKAGIKRGDNLFALDLEQAERTLTEDPWVSSVKFSRKLPNTLKMVVTELRAAAVAAISGSLYLVTKQGQPIKAISAGDHTDFPVVTGITTEQLAADRERAIERIAQGLDILRRYSRLSLAKSYSAQEVHLGPDGNVDLVIGAGGITLRLGKGPFRQKLLMAGRVMGKVRARGQTPGIVFLDNQAHPERVVVRMR